MTSLDKCEGGVPIGEMIVMGTAGDMGGGVGLRNWYLTRELNKQDYEVSNVYPVTMSPPTPASSTDYWIDNYFTISPPENLLTHELEPVRIEPSKLFLKLMERI